MIEQNITSSRSSMFSGVMGYFCGQCLVPAFSARGTRGGLTNEEIALHSPCRTRPILL